MSSKPQSASSRRGDGAAQSEFGGDDTLSQGSDAVELLTKGVIRRGLSDIQRSSDKKNFAFTRLDLTGQGIKNLEGDLATYPSDTNTEHTARIGDENVCRPRTFDPDILCMCTCAFVCIYGCLFVWSVRCAI